MKMMSCLEETDPGGMLHSALRIDDIDRLRLSPTERISVIWVDISARPDLAALAVHRAPEPGAAVCTWLYGNPGKRTLLMGLRIALKKPTPAVFTLLFPVERWAGHLSLIARYGKLWVVPGPPQAHPVGMQDMDAHLFLRHVVKYSGQGVLIELGSPLVTAVRTQLDQWKRHYIT